MASPIENAAAAARASQKALAGVLIDISNGTDTVYGVTATVGETVFESLSQDGIAIEFRTRDFLIDRTDYDFCDGAGPVLPARGHIITLPMPEGDRRFEVLPVQDAAYRRSDRGGGVLRVHTQELGE